MKLLLRHTQSSGYTLIEVLIALLIFSIMGMLSMHTLHTSIRTQSAINHNIEQLQQLQLALSLLEQDLGHVTHRPILIKNSQYSPSVLGDTKQIEFTRNNVPVFDNTIKRSTLQRIVWICKSAQLIRRRWASLDQRNAQQFSDQVLLTDLKACEFHSLDATHNLHKKWPHLLNSDKDPIPTAIRVTLDLPHYGRGYFLFIIPIGLYYNAISNSNYN